MAACPGRFARHNCRRPILDLKFSENTTARPGGWLYRPHASVPDWAGELHTSLVAPANWVRALKGGVNGRDRLADWLDEHVYRGGAMRDLATAYKYFSDVYEYLGENKTSPPATRIGYYQQAVAFTQQSHSLYLQMKELGVLGPMHEVAELFGRQQLFGSRYTHVSPPCSRASCGSGRWPRGRPPPRPAPRARCPSAPRRGKTPVR